MKMKRLIWILALAILLSGCAREPVGRAVTGIQVEYEQPGSTISRTYTQTANIKYMLTYLRLLQPLFLLFVVVLLSSFSFFASVPESQPLKTSTSRQS